MHGALLDSQILAQVYLSMTGGQDSLLVDPVEQGAVEPQEHGSIIKEQLPTPVIKANAAELALDKEYFND